MGLSLKPAKLTILAQNIDHDSSEIEIKIREGKYHQIKRNVWCGRDESVRTRANSMGQLTLPADLKRGEYIELSLDQVSKIK